MSTAEDARRLARTAGLKDLDLPRLEQVDRRRAQLWFLSLLAALAIPAAMVAIGLDIVPDVITGAMDERTYRLALLALLVVVMGYVAEREVTLRRLTALLVEERVLTASLVNRIDELNLLLKATRLMNSTLDLDQVLTQITDAAHRLLNAAGAMIMLVDEDDPDELVVVAAAGDARMEIGARQAIGEGLAGGAIKRRDALLVAEGETPSQRMRQHVGGVLVVPMEIRGQLVGILNVWAGEVREPFTEFDLRSVSVFAEAAAGAITNAQVYERVVGQVTDLEEQDRIKDEFLTLVTHELRTPLTSVIGLLTTLSRRADTLPPDKIAEYAEIARTEGWRLDRLIDNLLQSSRIQRGVVAIVREPIDVVAAVRRLVTGFEQRAADRTITLEAPPELVAEVDSDALLRIVENLVGNALKYTPAGSPIEVVVAAQTELLQIKVIDHGPGIPAEQRSALQGKFARGPDPHHAGGLGLGLYVVNALAAAHGGGVDIGDTPGGGATFTVVLHAPRPAP